MVMDGEPIVTIQLLMLLQFLYGDKKNLRKQPTVPRNENFAN